MQRRSGSDHQSRFFRFLKTGACEMVHGIFRQSAGNPERGPNGHDFEKKRNPIRELNVR